MPSLLSMAEDILVIRGINGAQLNAIKDISCEKDDALIYGCRHTHQDSVFQRVCVRAVILYSLLLLNKPPCQRLFLFS